MESEHRPPFERRLRLCKKHHHIRFIPKEIESNGGSRRAADGSGRCIATLLSLVHEVGKLNSTGDVLRYTNCSRVMQNRAHYTPRGSRGLQIKGEFPTACPHNFSPLSGRVYRSRQFRGYNSSSHVF